jgi:hypothetical protein
MSTKSAVETAEQTHDAKARRLGPGVYRAEDACGWQGPVREGPWWEAKRQAEADADVHSGREVQPPAKGPTPTRPVRISEELWSGVVRVAEGEGVTQSEVLRRAIAAYAPVAEAIEALEPVA